MRNRLILGVLGGMGTYATIHLFKKYAEIFKADKEWDRPRLIIDNRCTMPSRVLAYINKENIKQLIEEMYESLKALLDLGCNKIIVDCNTAHLFLPEIYKKLPSLNNILINIIESSVNEINDKEVFLLGTEAIIESKIYEDKLKNKNINLINPSKEDYSKIRLCIEAVKRNRYDDKIRTTFLELINKNKNCILGCTELPILYDMYKNYIDEDKHIYDPVEISLKNIYNNYKLKGDK